MHDKSIVGDLIEEVLGLHGITVMFLIFQVMTMHYSSIVCVFMYNRMSKLSREKVKKNPKLTGDTTAQQ